MKAIRTEAQLTSFRSRADGSIGFSGVTPEMSSTEKCVLFDLQNVLVEMVILPKDEKDPELVVVKTELGQKTASQRIRAILFLLWRQHGSEGEFNSYYAKRTEGILDWLKLELDKLTS